MQNMSQRDALNTKNDIFAHQEVNFLLTKFFRQKLW